MEKLKIIYIEWNDSAQELGWQDKEDLERSPSDKFRCKTIGFLVKEKPDRLILACSENKAQFGGVWVIPKENITKKQLITN